MTHRIAATRYARALLDVGARQERPETIERELADVVDMLDGHRPLRAALVSPRIPPARKRAVLDELFRRLGTVSALTRRLLLMLADRGRLALLPAIREIYRHRMRELQGITRAEITTATPLPPDRVRAVAEALERTTGRQVEIEARVDPKVIGGLVARVGSTVYDGSIARHLARLRRRFLVQA